MASLEDFIEQAVQRVGADPDLVNFLLRAYETGPLAPFLQTALSDSVVVPGKSTLVLFSGTDPSGARNEQLAKAYVDANPDAYGIFNTEAGQYLNSVSTQAELESVFDQLLAEAKSEGIDVQDSELWAFEEPLWRAVSTELAVQSTYETVVESNENVQSAARLLSVAHKSFDVANARYKGGAGTILEVLNAQSSLAKARRQRVTSLADYGTASLQLAAKLGRLRDW